MNNFIYLIPVVLVLGAIFYFISMNTKSNPKGLPYEKKKRLLSNAELSFGKVLSLTVSDKVSIATKVRMADLITVKKGLENKERMRFFGKISQKHADYVLHDSKTSDILLVIELDDKSHNSKRAQQADAFKNDAYASAGVEIYRVPASNTYSPVTLAKELSELGISINESLQDHTETDDEKETSISPPESACPKCGSVLQVKHSEKNQSDFIGCSSFPKCRYTQAI